MHLLLYSDSSYALYDNGANPVLIGNARLVRKELGHVQFGHSGFMKACSQIQVSLPRIHKLVGEDVAQAEFVMGSFKPLLPKDTIEARVKREDFDGLDVPSIS